MARKIPPIDTDYLVDQYRAGRSSNDLAREIGVSAVTITTRLKAAGCEIRGYVHRLDHAPIVAAYADGESSKKIAARIGVTQKVVARILRQNGVVMRPSASAPSVTISLDEARVLFESGIGVAGVAERLGTSASVIYRVFRDAGITTRTRRQQQFVRMSNTDADGRKRLAAAANAACRGRKSAFDALARTAATIEIRQSRFISPTETALAEMLECRGIPTIKQAAIGPYNCDLAAHPVAVEVFGGHWHWHGAHIARTEERFRYIMNAGWHIIAVAIWKSFPLTAAIADYLVAEINRLRCDPTIDRQYRVIWGANEFSVGGRLDDDHISIEPPFTRARNPMTGQYERVSR